jgi:hypothetical protein
MLFGKPESKESLLKLKYRWDDTKVDIKEIVCENVDGIQVAQDVV